MESNKKHTIWNSDPNYADWKADMEAEYPDLSEDERVSMMYDTNNEYLDDERINLDIALPGDIIVIASLGLWDGRKDGYKILSSRNVKDCLYLDGDGNIDWYVQNNDLQCRFAHHDGCNHYTYRMIKPDCTDELLEAFTDAIYNGTCTDQDIEQNTLPIGPYIQNVYGW